MDRPIVAVVLAGGTGTRLYPASRADRPKQFRSLPLPGAAGDDRSLLARTVDRCSFADRRVVLTGDRHADRAREHAPGADVLIEPAARDTGPALAYATARLRGTSGGRADRTGERGAGGGSDPVILAVPSDHHVGDDAAFAATARHACRVAVETRGLVTMGVDPDRPATGYGYVRPGRWEDDYAPVREFTEKPDRSRAETLVEEGCLWNAGIFAWTPDAFLREARDSPLAPIVAAAEDGGERAPAGSERAGGDGGSDPDSDGSDDRDADPLAAAVREVDPVSVDYAVMERTDRAFVVRADFAWDDLGTWDALARLLPTDDDGNAVLGDAATVDAADNVIAAEDAHVSVVGADDLVVAAYDDRVLVVPKDDAGRVRDLVDRLRDEGTF